MWGRSVDLMDAQYVSILGDGDAAVMSALNSLQPYGARVVVEKQQCISHLSKRMYKGLDNIMQASIMRARLQASIIRLAIISTR